MTYKLKKSLIALTCLSAMALTGCGGSSNNDDDKDIDVPDVVVDTSYEYEVSLVNVTSNQPLSPIALITHDEDNGLFALGEESSEALELLAEAGDNSGILAVSTNVSTESDDGLLLPGETYTQTIETQDTSLNLTILSMLVNTNDAITGLNNTDLADYAVGDKKSFSLRVYDSGTEANTETATTIPGPASGGTGEGFNAVRDDLVNVVTMHAGVVSQDDGLTDSVLNATHRFDNVVAKVSITRTK